jgi:phospholipid/cholesterol/gamma-HCH transport system permease protein
LTGFLAAFINVRISAPIVAGIGLAATFGAGVTAQLGAMRINEEIDALESMAIRPISYLVSTRIIAGMIAITPLYSIAVILSFVASQFTTVFLLGQSGGLYDHYFNTFLNPIDLLWSFLQAILMALAILLIHTYYGYFATGGPSGVGVAVGNAVRTSLVVVVSVTLLVSLAIYGSNGNFNLSG